MCWSSRTMAIVHFVLMLCLCVGVFSQRVPEQIHLSYGLDPTQMVVTWSTMNETTASTAKYGPGIPSQTASGTSTKFVDIGSKHHTQYIHRVTMTGLKPGAKYVYKVGSWPENVWSDTFHFTAMRAGTDWAPSIALYGDLGYENPASMKRLLIDESSGMYDAILHVGDFAYDFDTDDGTLGDKFMNLIQPLAANLAYMTCPGNHEHAGNFTHYKNRFAMPTDMYGEKMFYSFNMGPIHVISLSTEYLFYLDYGILQIPTQYHWLTKDLQEANKPENRAQHPWIIVMGHRPMYCSNKGDNDCTKTSSRVRTGLPVVHTYGFEKLFWDYGVDLMFWAHEHSYERLWPVYNEKVMNGSYDAPYTNPKAPVNIITGSAGCREKHAYFKNDTATWSAFRSDDYGYTRMKVFNASHLYLEQVSDEKQGAVVDTMWLIKDKHGPYN